MSGVGVEIVGGPVRSKFTHWLWLDVSSARTYGHWLAVSDQEVEREFQDGVSKGWTSLLNTTHLKVRSRAHDVLQFYIHESLLDE